MNIDAELSALIHEAEAWTYEKQQFLEENNDNSSRND